MSVPTLTKPDVGDLQGIPPCLPSSRRILKHPRVMHYNRLVVLVLTVNPGWAALALVWINTMLFVEGDRDDQTLGSALLVAPAFWLVVRSAAMAVWPWLPLRRVPIDCERPSPLRRVAPLRQRACRAGNGWLSNAGLARR